MLWQSILLIRNWVFLKAIPLQPKLFTHSTWSYILRKSISIFDTNSNVGVMTFINIDPICFDTNFGSWKLVMNPIAMKSRPTPENIVCNAKHLVLVCNAKYVEVHILLTIFSSVPKEKWFFENSPPFGIGTLLMENNTFFWAFFYVKKIFHLLVDFHLRDNHLKTFPISTNTSVLALYLIWTKSDLIA